MADAALQSLQGGPMNRRAVLHTMGGRGSEHYAMLRTLTDDLKLINKGHDTFSLTLEGRKAVQMGFRAYMEERERKAKEPIPVHLVDNRPLWKLNKRELIQSSISAIIGAVIGKAVELLCSFL